MYSSPPTTYAEWCNLFDEMANAPRNDIYVSLIRMGSLPWIDGVAQRFVSSLTEMMKQRSKKAQDTFASQIRNAKGNAVNVSAALGVLKKELQFLHAIAKSLPIPSEYVLQVMDMVREQAEATQSTLENSAKADRTGNLLRLIRNTNITKLEG